MIFKREIVFYSNIFFVLFFIFSVYFELSLKWFFYIVTLLCLVFGYVLFRESKTLSQKFILSNMFLMSLLLTSLIFSSFEIFGTKTSFFILLCNLGITCVFISLSKSFRFVNFGIPSFGKVGFVGLLGVVFGVVFFLIQEPVYALKVLYNYNYDFLGLVFFIIVATLLEQLIFIGFFFDNYCLLYSRRNSFVFSSLLFVLFHFLYLKIVLQNFMAFFLNFSFLFFGAYCVLLFLFMYVSILLYSSFCQKKSFFYSVFFHFVTNSALFFLIFTSLK